MIIATCFTPGSYRVLTRGEGVYFGGTDLLPLFMRRLALEDSGGRLLLVAPFLNDELLGAEHGVLAGLRHQGLALTVITSGPVAAQSVVDRLRPWPWGSLRVLWHKRLHGKMYLACSNTGRFTGLIGSHNLTRSGMRSNVEFGVMISGRGGPLREVFNRCELHARRLEGKANRAPTYDHLHSGRQSSPA